MKLTYFDVKRELKKIYILGIQAIKRKDQKYINFLISNLEQLNNSLVTFFVLDDFGIYTLKKDISLMHLFLKDKMRRKIVEDIAHEKKSKARVKSRD